MIGVITYISVLERKKEIGILRSIGASKGDISRVFNAETIIVRLRGRRHRHRADRACLHSRQRHRVLAVRRPQMWPSCRGRRRWCSDRHIACCSRSWRALSPQAPPAEEGPGRGPAVGIRRPRSVTFLAAGHAFRYTARVDCERPAYRYAGRFFALRAPRRAVWRANGTREVRNPPWVHPGERGLRHRPGQRVALPLHHGRVRRRGVRAHCTWCSWPSSRLPVADHGVRRGPRKPASSIARSFDMLEPAGTKWHCVQVAGACRQLPAHDVLHHRGAAGCSPSW